MWPDDAPLVAIGAMRLSTTASRDDDQSLATLHAALDEGVSLIDTADAYALDAADAGHNERLIARALATWPDEGARVRVITKGGLIRPEGRWMPDGRARHLRAACDASRRALGVRRVSLYQLHAPDPRVPWTTSVRALAGLSRDQLIEAVGLCNINCGQLAIAREIVPIATVQCELSPWKDSAVAGGLVEYCAAHAIRFLAHRPFGGVAGARRLASDAVLREVAVQRDVSPFAVVIAWLRGLAPHIVPLPGPTRAETARDAVRAQRLVLDDGEQTALDRHFPAGRIRTSAPLPPRRAGGGQAEVVMVMGLPGAGKSTHAERLVSRGYERLNRDETGGSLAALVPRLEQILQSATPRVVLDNTYLTRAARAAVIDAVRARGRVVRGVWLETSLEEAQVNVVSRMVQMHGRLLTADELKRGGGPDRLSPSALFRAQRALEPPEINEGFSELERIPFVRAYDPSYAGRAVLLWRDVLLAPSAADRMRERLAGAQADGWRLIAFGWEPQVSERGMSSSAVEEDFARVRDRFALDIEFHYCPHGAGPPVCWCRKPLPGLGVLVVHRHRLDTRQCIYVGMTPQDPPFARRLNVAYVDAEAFQVRGLPHRELTTEFDSKSTGC